MVFYAQGGIQGSTGPERCGLGSQMDPLDGPTACLVEGNTFIQTPLLGYGAIDPPEKEVRIKVSPCFGPLAQSVSFRRMYPAKTNVPNLNQR